MSIDIMAKVFANETLGPSPRLVLLALADHAGEDGTCYPSISRLCRRTGMSERAVQKHLKALQAEGYIDIRYGEGRGGANLYTVRATPRTTCTPAPDAPPHDVHPPHDMPPAPRAPTPRTTCTPTPAPRAPKPSGNHQGTVREGARGSRLPDDWALPRDWGQWAMDEGLTEFEVKRQAAIFADHWHAQAGAKGRKADWRATWRNWVRRSVSDFSARRPASQAATGTSDRIDRWSRMGRGGAQ